MVPRDGTVTLIPARVPLRCNSVGRGPHHQLTQALPFMHSKASQADSCDMVEAGRVHHAPLGQANGG